mmetsp:Transcript_93926/g.214773  ORF Transcript_93926/g.214773 Transcript_93926/m.214773 type:complete len:1274 (+) Transcript_93926:90-3911(+)
MDPLHFGITREDVFKNHASVVTHLIPLRKQSFASVDETTIRLWNRHGEQHRYTFPKNKRGMVSSIVYFHKADVILTAEVDLTFKAYTDSLELLEVFHSQGKVQHLLHIPTIDAVIAAGESGAQVWQFAVKRARRQQPIGRYEHHLDFTLLRNLGLQHPVVGLSTNARDSRIMLWTKTTFYLFDYNFSIVASCEAPHAEPVTCATFRYCSALESIMLTGSEDTAVNFWTISTKSLQSQSSKGPSSPTSGNSDGAETAGSAMMRLEHSFLGHTQKVAFVAFYDGPETLNQKFAVSIGLDDTLRVWSLEMFTPIYSLEVGLLPSRARLFALGRNTFAASAVFDKSATVVVARFTTDVAKPYVATNRAQVALLHAPPGPSNEVRAERHQLLAVTSEDMVVRLLETGGSHRVVATLPPPPNSLVQIKAVFVLMEPYRVLVLWLSSLEIAVFFVPPWGDSQVAPTPTLVRRFCVLDLATPSGDRELITDKFTSVAADDLQCPPLLDMADPSHFRRSELLEQGKQKFQSQFIVIGTATGRLLFLEMGEVLSSSGIWDVIASRHGLPGSQPAPFSEEEVEGVQGEAALRRHAEDKAAMVLPGQASYPAAARNVCLWGRYQVHHYGVTDMWAVGFSVVSVDVKRNVKVTSSASMETVFTTRVEPATCSVMCYSLQEEEDIAASPEGLVLGTQAGSLQLVQMPEGHVLSSSTAHSDAVQALDYLASLGVVASIGGDQSVRLWSVEDLTELQTVYFPQQLTTLAFLAPGPEEDTAGDLVLGFAQHACLLPRTCWSSAVATGSRSPSGRVRRGRVVDEFSPLPTMTANKMAMVRSMAKRWSMKVGRKRMMARVEEAQSIDELPWLSAKDPVVAKAIHEATGGESRSRRRGGSQVQMAEGMESPWSVTRRNLASVRAMAGQQFSTDSQPAERSPNTSLDIKDFRGGPVVPVGELYWPQPPVESRSLFNPQHSRSVGMSDDGALATVTHQCTQVYYDKLIDASDLCAASRGKTIRGGVDEDDTALVTSVGYNYLRYEQSQETRAPSSPNRSRILETEDSRTEWSYMLSKQEPEEDPRQYQVARGALPRRLQRPPPVQNVGYSDKSLAVLLHRREELVELSDLQEKSLRDLVRVKNDWTFGLPNSQALKNAAAASRQPVEHPGASKKWRPGGRRFDVVPAGKPGILGVSRVGDPQLGDPGYVPMTRSEVTELRILERARGGTPPPPRLNISTGTGSTPRQPRTARARLNPSRLRPGPRKPMPKLPPLDPEPQVLIQSAQRPAGTPAGD